MRRFLLVLAVCALAEAQERPLPYRTDGAGADLPWYRLKPLEFPPARSEHRRAGDLMSVDIVRRAGEIRVDGTGEILDFLLLPFGSATRLGAEADLRDLPLGAHVAVWLYQDPQGAFTLASKVEDDASELLREDAPLGIVRVDALRGLVTAEQPGAPPHALSCDPATRVWKSGREAKLADLGAGDEIVFNCSGRTVSGKPLCSEIYAGRESWRQAEQKQRAKHQIFLKERGIPGWVEQVDGKEVTLTLFGGDRETLRGLLKPEGALSGKYVKLAVANEELRTYDPQVDAMRAKVLRTEPGPEAFGSGGERLTLRPELLLEGFRKGRVVRLFLDLWPVKDMPRGESLYDE